MSLFEDRLRSHISSLYKTKHPNFIPQLSGLIPILKTSPQLWASLSKEILTPFAPKFKIYNFEKYLPTQPFICKRRTNGMFGKLESQDSKDSINIDNNSYRDSLSKRSSQTPQSPRSPRYSKSPRFFLPDNTPLFNLKSKNLLKHKIIGNSMNIERLIFRKSNSIDLLKPVEFHDEEKKPINIKSKFEKMKNFALIKNKTHQNIAIKDIHYSGSLNVNSQQNNVIFREIFRRKSCKCKYCGNSGKMGKILTVFTKKSKIKENNDKIEKLEKNERNDKFDKHFFRTIIRENVISKHNSIKSDEKDVSFKDFKFLEKQRLSVVVRINTIENMEPLIFKKQEKKRKIDKFINPSKNEKKTTNMTKSFVKKNFFLLNKYGVQTKRNQLKHPLFEGMSINKSINTSKEKLNPIVNNFSLHNETSTERTSLTFSEDQRKEVSEIIYANGSLRTKNLFHKQIPKLSKRLAERVAKSPYVDDMKERMDILKSFHKKH